MGLNWLSLAECSEPLRLRGHIMQEGWDNFMSVYIHLHPTSPPICAFVKSSMLVFLRNVAFLNLFCAEQRRASVPGQKQSSQGEGACLSQQLGGCLLINSQLDAEGWSLASPLGFLSSRSKGRAVAIPASSLTRTYGANCSCSRASCSVQ